MEAKTATAPAPGARKTEMPDSVKPMLATLSEDVFSDPEWVFEVKWDGVRTVAFYREGTVRLMSRNFKDITATFPEVAAAIPEALAGHDTAIIDGEIVAFEAGRPNFQRLQERINLSQPGQIRRKAVEVPTSYCVFDIIYLDGFLLTDCQLTYRKEVMHEAVRPVAHIEVPAEFEEQGERFFEAARVRNLEGIVAKAKNSTYLVGRRSRTWLKFKVVHTMEAVVGGYTDPRGGRKYFGALLLGLYDDDGKLEYIGHTGTGFNEKRLAAMHQTMQELRTEDCPFDVTPDSNMPAHWLKPQLVAEIKYAEVTADNRLRHPVFLRIRNDKPPEECTVREQVPQSVHPKPEARLQQSTVRLTNKSKILWPAVGDNPPVTKEKLAQYYNEMAQYILPFVHNRPLMLNRFPNGVSGERFYQKDYKDPVPPGVEDYVYHSRHADRDIRHVLCNNSLTLKWLAQLACVELNCWMSRIDCVDKPDFIVFDLDPYVTWRPDRPSEPHNKDDYQAAVEVARRLRPLLDHLRLNAYLKTSGQTGLHVFVPLRRQYSFAQVNSYGKAVARHMEQTNPELITTAWSEPERAGRVFFDYSMNARGKTFAAVYSPRPSPLATISMPILWDELDTVFPTDFTIFSASARMKKMGDLWSGILSHAQSLMPPGVE